MLHGAMISIDNQKNPIKTDIYPDNPKEMLYFVFVFLSPSISLCLMERTVNFYFFLSEYLIPSFAYIAWDWSLKKDLELRKNDVNESRKDEINKFYRYAFQWFVSDSIGLALCVLFIIFGCLVMIGSSSLENGFARFVFTTLVVLYQGLMIALDYKRNSDFYFPK